MPTLYDREGWVQIDDRRIVGLRLKFKATKSLKKDPNTLDLHVFNLSADTRATLKKKGARVIVVAGYVGNSQVVFSGEARTVDHVRVGADWDTHVQCGDGEIALAESHSSFSFKAGAKWEDVVGQIGKDLKIDTADALANLFTGGGEPKIDQYVHGYTASGASARELDSVMTAAELEWSVQDGKLQILQPGKPARDSAIVLSPRTGLIGSPDHGTPEKDGSPSLLKAKSLLQAGIRAGRAVKIESTSINGFYRVEKVVHEGDTHGAEWHSTIEALPL